MKEKIKEKLNIYGSLISLIILISCIIFIIIKGISYLDEKHSEKHWNNGYCKCGGQWEYVQFYPSPSEIKYYYECNKCHNIEGFNKRR